MQNNCVLALNSFYYSKLSIFPNPTSNLLSINNPTNQIVNKIAISNANGQIVSENDFIKDKMDVSNLPNGLYIITISLENENVHLKFQKK